MKSEKADKGSVDAAVAMLLSLKAKYKAATGKDWKPGNFYIMNKTDMDIKIVNKQASTSSRLKSLHLPQLIMIYRPRLLLK